MLSASQTHQKPLPHTNPSADQAWTVSYLQSNPLYNAPYSLLLFRHSPESPAFYHWNWFHYKTVDTLRVGDVVYSLDPETGAIIEDKCLDVISKGTNNTIYNIKTTSGTVRLTSEHNVYVVEYGDLDRSGFDKTIVKKKVKDLNVGDIMLTSCKLPNIKSNTCNTINVTDVVKDFLNNMEKSHTNYSKSD